MLLHRLPQLWGETADFRENRSSLVELGDRVTVLEFSGKKGSKVKQKKNCVKGNSCGFTCIRQGAVCRSEMKGKEKEFAGYLKKATDAKPKKDKHDIPDVEKETIAAKSDLKKAVKAPKGKGENNMQSKLSEEEGIAPYIAKRTLGKGMFGTVELTDRGTVVKKNTGVDLDQAEIRREFEAVRHLHSVGVGPEAIGIQGKNLEIGLVKGKPLVKIKDEESQMSAQMEAAKSLLKLHKSGWSHNDAHDNNVMIQKDGKIKLVDAGMAMPVGGTISRRDDGSDILSRAGISDIHRIAYYHPEVQKLSKALKPALDAHWKVTSYCLTASIDQSQKNLLQKNAEIELHKAYLSVASQFIK